MLDVLEPDPIGPPDEDGPRVLRVDDPVDLETPLSGLVLDQIGSVDEEREVVEQWARGLLGAAVAQHDPLARHVKRAVLPVEAHRFELARRRARIPHAKDDVIEVGRLVSRDEPEWKLRYCIHAHHPVTLDELETGRTEAGARILEIGHAQSHTLQHAALPRPVGVEERQLPAAGVAADEREVVRPLDLVHRAAPGQQRGQPISLGDP